MGFESLITPLDGLCIAMQLDATLSTYTNIRSVFFSLLGTLVLLYRIAIF